MTTFDKKCLLAVNHRCISLGKHSTIRDPTIIAEPIVGIVGTVFTILDTIVCITGICQKNTILHFS